MRQHLGTLGFILLMLFGVYVILADSPLRRIERACAPTEWLGKTVASFTSLFSEPGEARAKVAMGELTLSCQYLVYRQFYKDEFEAMKSSAEAEARTEDQQGAGV